MLNPKTKLVALVYVSNMLGSVLKVHDVAAEARKVCTAACEPSEQLTLCGHACNCICTSSCMRWLSVYSSLFATCSIAHATTQLQHFDVTDAHDCSTLSDIFMVMSKVALQHPSQT